MCIRDRYQRRVHGKQNYYLLLIKTRYLIVLNMLKYSRILRYFSSRPNPFAETLKTLSVDGKEYKYYSLPELKDEKIEQLPYSIRILLEAAVRDCDEFNVKTSDVKNILDWETTAKKNIEIPFKPARVLMQDLTGVPCMVDLAGMRDAMVDLGGDPKKINPLCPVDLVVDHSVVTDFHGTKEAAKLNEQAEFKRNKERFEFLKWGQKSFQNCTIIPPGSGIVHQLNLEYIARIVMQRNGLIFPDSCVGTDSHTPMVNGLGVLGWGVGGIEAEAVMLGECISMVLPQVVGLRFVGELRQNVTATDLVLTCVEFLRKQKVVGQFVEFFGPGAETLSLADRATVANMCPEYGATMGFFPFDEKSLDYAKMTGRDAHKIKMIEAYMKENMLWKQGKDPKYSRTFEIDLGKVEPCISGPKRPHDRVTLPKNKKEWDTMLTAKVGFKGFGMTPAQAKTTVPFKYQDKEYVLKNGDIILSAITSCTNTSNPDVLIAAGLLAKRAIEKGLSVKPYIKTILAPGSRVVTQYLEKAGLQEPLEKLGYHTTGYGCMPCIGNSGEVPAEVNAAIDKGKLVCVCCLSSNRNFEGRVYQNARANYLASPPLVLAYALAGTMNIDFEKQPLGKDSNGEDVFLRDIWPTREEVSAVAKDAVDPKMFEETYATIMDGNEQWKSLDVPVSDQFGWSSKSTYLHKPPYFDGMKIEIEPVKDIVDAYCLANFGDSITTDHISPANKIAKNSPAAKYLESMGVKPKDYSSYGTRRGNDEVMVRGTFANGKLINKMVEKPGPNTLYIPDKKVMPIFDASLKYRQSGKQLVILAGQEYGSGSSRDWAAKGPYLQGVKAVIAESFERIHRSNLIGMGIIPFEYTSGQNADKLGLKGNETFSIELKGGNLAVNEEAEVKVSTGKTFIVKNRLDTEVEIEYIKNGGIMQYVLRLSLIHI
eukprot:TRINITY_DN1127_c0_g1_i3.p1 TRINITY_DN1127_c0_g1~~TRINITY_DN1127_c0_g1_i3.p1  ORF type:complete len:933 (-),score=211.27 TRINITY_DN1127_c0_g1_i3:74-2872(-)